MSRKFVHTPSDIEYKYGTKKYNEIVTYWEKYNGRGKLPDLLFLLALVGVTNNRRISLDTEDGDGKQEFSRVVYQRSIVQMESIIGLISILGNDEENKEKLLNEIAFAKMDTHQLRFNQLPNIRDFYEFVLGGIDPLHNLMFEIGKDSIDIAATIYDEAIEIEEELLLIADKMKADELDE